MVRAKLTFWKANYLSLGGRLTLLNSVLSSIPTYWMSVFKLPVWVVKEIDKIYRDFFWKGPELGPKGMRLVAWSRICRPRNMGGWGILNIQEFNKALLGKWWWKIHSEQNSCWLKVIHLNYLNKASLGLLFHTPHRINLSFGQVLHPFYHHSDHAPRK